MKTVPFSMRMDEGLRASLDEEARLRERPASFLVGQAVDRYLLQVSAERELLKARLAEAEGGNFVSSEAVLDWMDSWGNDRQPQVPKASDL